MRIRKNAKISPLLYATSSLSSGGANFHTHICQLNQSPWDVMTFSPPSSSFQANGSQVDAGNGSSDNCVSVPEREIDSQWQPEYSDTISKVEAPPPPAKNEAIIFCCKTDGKSWHCPREAAEGNSLCEHHIALVRSYSNVVFKKAPEEMAAVEAPRPRRTKKAPVAYSSNPSEFYYYTDFRSRQSKQRAENIEVEAIFGIDIDFTDYEDDEEDEEEEDENKNKRKKRIRKPIKARSLKSLF